MSALARDFHAPLFRTEFTFGARPEIPPGLPTATTLADHDFVTGSFASPIVLAVSSNKLAPAGARLVAGPHGHQYACGRRFLELEVEWPQIVSLPAGQGILPSLYVTGIALILSTTILAGYLLLRDVDEGSANRRDARALCRQCFSRVEDSAYRHPFVRRNAGQDGRRTTGGGPTTHERS